MPRTMIMILTDSPAVAAAVQIGLPDYLPVLADPEVFTSRDNLPGGYAPCGEPVGTATIGVPRTVPLDFFATPDEVICRRRLHDQPAGAGDVLATARLVPATDGDGNVWRTRITMQAGPVDYDHRTEAYNAMRSAWTSTDVRTFSSLHPMEDF